jgi:hypothetical protein
MINTPSAEPQNAAHMTNVAKAGEFHVRIAAKSVKGHRRAPAVFLLEIDCRS